MYGNLSKFLVFQAFRLKPIKSEYNRCHEQEALKHKKTGSSNLLPVFYVSFTSKRF